MTLTVHPGKVDGKATAPPSKSYTHRAYILAALAGGGRVEYPLRAEDTDSTMIGLVNLGVEAQDDGHYVEFTRGIEEASAGRSNLANSGTSLRLLSAVASLTRGPHVLDGDMSLRARPMQGLLDALVQLGARAKSQGGHCPLTVEGPIRGGPADVDASASSQFVSALLLAGAMAPDGLELRLTQAPRSQPYVDVTITQMRVHGLRVNPSGDGYSVPGAQTARPTTYRVPGDYSSAAFLFGAAAATGGRVAVDNLDPEDPQGDRAVLEILESFGCSVDWSGSSVTVEGGPLTAQTVDLGRTPDLFPVLCAVASVAEGTTRLVGAPHLRVKESDRIHAMATNLTTFGVACRELEDGIEIVGGRPQGGTVHSFGDHRIAQAGILLGLAGGAPAFLDDPGVLGVSYPKLLDALEGIGGRTSP